MDSIWAEELDFANRLRECEERADVDIQTSSEILHNMAVLHMKRAPDKLSLLYSSALFVGAILRNPSKESKILKDVNYFNRVLLKHALAKRQDISLWQFSKEIYKGPVAKMRKQAEEALTAIKILTVDLNTGEEETEKESEKIKLVRKMMDDVAESYTDIMRKISNMCLEILGPPPCKFAHASMGSLPKREITPYSDLESFILLDNDVKKHKNYDKVLEYFRWYTVIFQIILINFGESPLRLMGIPSLNDFYFHSKAKDWFWDDVATCGIQFDSMRPLASKFPLGRRETEKRKWKTELIKTVKDMVKYVHSDEAIQNGYNLACMLTRTGFISGNESVYKKFVKRVQKNLIKEEKSNHKETIQMLKQIEGNLYDFSTNKILDDEIGAKVNIKKAVYRTVTIFIIAIGKLLNIESCSCYGIIEALKDLGYLSETAAHNLMFAVSVACEIRMKVYMSKSTQADMVLSGSPMKCSQDTTKVFDLIDAVGKYSIFTFFLIAHEFQRTIREILKCNGAMDVLKVHAMREKDLIIKIEVLHHFGLYKDALLFTKKIDHSQYRAHDNIPLYLMKGICSMHLGYYEDASEQFNVCLATVLSVPESDLPCAPAYIIYCQGKNKWLARKLTAAKKYLYEAREAFELNMEANSIDEGRENVYVSILSCIVSLHFSAGEYRIAYHDSQILLPLVLKYLNTDRAFFTLDLMKTSAISLKKVGRYKESVKLFQNVLDSYGSVVRENPHFKRKSPHSVFVVSIYSEISECYIELKEYGAAEDKCNEALKVIGQIVMEDDYDYAYVKFLLSQCHLKQSRYRKAAEVACEAFSVASQIDEAYTRSAVMMHAAVKVIFRSILPVCNNNLVSKDGYTDKDLQATLDCATKVYLILTENVAFSSKAFESDKSVLVRVIQRTIYELGHYENILQNCKHVFQLGLCSAEPSSFLQYLIDPVLSTPKLLDNAVKYSDDLVNIAKTCNIRDSISFPGALVILVGQLLHLNIQLGKSEDLLSKLESYLMQKLDKTLTVILHSTVKVATGAIDYFITPIKDDKVLQKCKVAVSLLINFATKVYCIVQSHENCDQSLANETAGLVNTIASCWMKFGDYEAGLKFYNEALSFQEESAKADFTYMGVSTILDNIGICLGRLDRLDEAKTYLKRALSVRDNRRRSIASQDKSIFQVKVRSAQCSFELQNYQEAASLACEAFHEGLGLETGVNRDQSMSTAAGIIIKSTLIVSVHSHSDSEKEKFPEEMVQSILENAETLAETLTDRSKQLGKSISASLEPLQYTIGNCYYVLKQYKQALRCFKKSLRNAKKQGESGDTEKSLLLNVSKSLIGLRQFKNAESYLQRFLSLENYVNKTNIVHHLHISHVHNLLSTCSLRQHKYFTACIQAYRAVKEAEITGNETLLKQVCKASSKVFLEVLNLSKHYSLELD